MTVGHRVPRGVKVSAHFNFADYWVGFIVRPGHVYIAPLPCLIVHVRGAK